ncbi:iron-containing alcohol dehydrogenase [Inediibacterium massiliense]|uniref:iron-containing alcohol dehydrogenase n=1 Tax=Inediibacterium massiliense TaxID=1658111 RepID=UPI0006B5293B|nr:iron-containing alcohol dehydrogenase [Inediibacterium massiliense]
MKNFKLYLPTKIIFGKDTESKAGQETKKYSKKVLLHYGGGSIKKYGLYEKITTSLKEEGIDCIELGGVQPNPRLSLVQEGIKICREEKIDFILAVGGGSVIDSAKSIAIGVPYSGDVWDFYTEKARPKEVLPIGVVLTIPATGSEASMGSVITNEEGWYKKACNHDLLRPQFAIMNPEVTYTLPPYQTSAGAVDIMAHVIERYFTNTDHVDLTDRLCEATLKTMIKNTPMALKDPKDYHARAEIMWAGTIAHNGILGTGRVEDWGSHRIEHELSGIYDVTHGAGLAVIIPAWMKYVYKHNINRFAQFAMRVWDVEYDFEYPENTALEGIRRLENFFQEIKMPTTLEELNIGQEHFEEMAQKCTQNKTQSVGSFVTLHEKDVVNIFQLATKAT